MTVTIKQELINHTFDWIERWDFKTTITGSRQNHFVCHV